MDSYVVHILRRQHSGDDEAAQLDGVVEVVGEGGRRRVFHNAEELWQILGDVGSNAPEGGEVTS
jgi:hypothetical protein